MKKRYQKLAALALAGLISASALAACGSTDSGNTAGTTDTAPTEETAETETDTDGDAAAQADAGETQTETDAAGDTAGSADLAALGGSGGSTDYTWMIGTGESSEYYDDYDEAPMAKWWTSQEYDPYGTDAESFSIDFWTPPAGSENEYFNNLLATGEYADVMDTSRLSEKPAKLYEDGVILDLTELAEAFMPNYLSWMDEHPEYADMLYHNVDGEKKLLMIYGLREAVEAPFCGFTYRRDWIARYGKNQETGEAFTGGWNDDYTEWTDDVVFPSGGTDPVYLSDWEWMMEIFEEAIADQGLADAYCFQLPSGGYWGTGEFVSGFGGGSGFYLDENGTCRYGFTSDNFRAYLECMRAWAEKGWINQGFEENTGTLFWNVDTPAVFSGLVGAWYGRLNQTGTYLMSDDPSSALYEVCIKGAATPINDIYGDASCQDKEPRQYFGFALVGDTGVVISNKAEDKDVGLLLSAIDDLYGENWIKAAKGYSDVEQAEIQDPFYAKYGIEGGYTVEADGTIVENTAVMEYDNLQTALRLIRVPFLSDDRKVDRGFTEIEEEAVYEWTKYDRSGYLLGAVTSQLTAEQSEEYSVMNSNLTTVMDQMVPQFINGELDVEDEGDWESFVSSLEAYDPEAYCGWINEILGK